MAASFASSSSSSSSALQLGAAAPAPLASAPPAAGGARGQELDLGILACFDNHPVDGYAPLAPEAGGGAGAGAGAGPSAAYAAAYARNEAALLRAARDNVQLLIRGLFELPVQATEDAGPVAVLPAPTTRLPRQQHVPRPKPLTRWQKFALAKGISKKKKETRVVDPATGEAAPRWGARRGAGKDDGEWLIEAKAGDDPTVDLFEQKRLQKQKRVLQNDISRVGNDQRAAWADEHRAGGGAAAGGAAPGVARKATGGSRERADGGGGGKMGPLGAVSAARPPPLSSLGDAGGAAEGGGGAARKRARPAAGVPGGADGPAEAAGMKRRREEEREASRVRAQARAAKVEGGVVPAFV
jgi:hypothetical protein